MLIGHFSTMLTVEVFAILIVVWTLNINHFILLMEQGLDFTLLVSIIWGSLGKHCVVVVEVWIQFHRLLFGLQSETKESWNWGKNEYDQNKDSFSVVGVFIYMMTHSCVYMVYDCKPCWDWTIAVLSYEICAPVFFLLSIINARSWNEKVISLERTRYNWHKPLP